MDLRPPPSPAVPSLSLRLLTERFVVRPPRPSDVTVLRAHLRSSADHLRPWSPQAKEGDDPTSLTALARLVVRQRREWRRGQGFAFVVTARDAEDGPLLGRVTVSAITRGVHQNGVLGYAVDRAHVCKGVATEAVGAVVAFAFEALRLHRLEAAVMPANAPSLRVLEKLRFRREGLLLRYLFIGERWQDHLLFARTVDE